MFKQCYCSLNGVPVHVKFFLVMLSSEAHICVLGDWISIWGIKQWIGVEKEIRDRLLDIHGEKEAGYHGLSWLCSFPSL